jgi:SAM-dependent methyltransferase
MNNVYQNKSWYEQDQFWELVEPFLFNEQRLSDAKDEVKNIVQLMKINQDDQILDLCCGIGRHSLELARQGFKVVGVDRTAFFINQAKQETEGKNLKVEFIVSDMREYCNPDRFNIIINMFGSFGYFENEDDSRTVVKNMYASLCPGGRFLIETMGKEILAREFQARDWFEDGDSLVLFERKPIKDWSRISNRWIVIKDNQKFEHSFSLRSYSAVELSSLLYECGFSKVQVHGDFEGSDYDNKAKRLVVMVYK